MFPAHKGGIHSTENDNTVAELKPKAVPRKEAPPKPVPSPSIPTPTPASQNL
ncbi:hypothetical protein SESBI_20078 [Sesbania bispinosa]|nr:hypothetical protein SESBI_20078 [Sesbania bispinosa]